MTKNMTPNKLTKLIVRVTSPPLILFKLEGAGVMNRTDITNKAESAWHDAEHYAFMVEYPGRYQVAQRNSIKNCSIDSEGVISWASDKKDDDKSKPAKRR